MQISALSAADLSPIASAPIRLGEELGPCLLYGAGRFDLGFWDGETWWDEEGGIRLKPERWLLLLP